MPPLEFCLSSSYLGNYTSYHFLLQEIPCPHPPPHLFIHFCLCPHLHITSESVKGFRCEVLIILNLAMSKLKTYDLNEELLKILKKELEEEKTRFYRMMYSATLQADKCTRRRYGMKFHKYHFMKFVYTYGILKIRIATTTRHQRSVQVMYELERYKIIKQNNVEFLRIQGRFPFGLYKKKINTKKSMSSLLFDEHFTNIGVEFNKL